MTGRKRPRLQNPVSPSDRVTEQLNAAYGDDEAASALDKVLEHLQFLSLSTDDGSSQPGHRRREPNRRGKSPDPAET